MVEDNQVHSDTRHGSQVPTLLPFHGGGGHARKCSLCSLSFHNSHTHAHVRYETHKELPPERLHCNRTNKWHRTA